MKKISNFCIITFMLLGFMFTSGCKTEDPSTEDPSSVGTVTDKDGNVYHTVKIGTQVWMVENLKTTTYNDGTAIQLVTDFTAWRNLSTPGYCWFNNISTYKNMYGALYNWYAVGTGKLAPIGWHVPTEAEWEKLNSYVTSKFGASGAAKALAATTDWNAWSDAGSIGNDLSKNNGTGFSALPGGYRFFNDAQGFSNFGDGGLWWSSSASNTAAWDWDLFCDYSAVYGGGDASMEKQNGLSVRCVKD